MKLSFHRLLKLPSSLLIASFVLVASALPVDSIELSGGLTPEIFESTIASGLWFIESFSPYCHHCRAFKPTWQRLVDENAALPNPVLHFERVDCSVYGDLCNKNGITGYPTMQMYRDGQFVEKFGDAREYDLLVEFLAKYTESSSSESEGEPDLKLIEQPRHESETKKYNPNGMVISLNPSNFKTVVDEGPTFIKFFAPWCGHCKKLAPIWTQVASHMRDKLTIAEVDCDAHSSLCRSEGIEGFPVMQFYSGGSGPDGHKTEYTGGRKFDQLMRFAEMAIAPAVREVQLNEYEDAVHEYPVVYLFLYSDMETGALNHLTGTSHVLLGTVPILTSTSNELRSRFSLPASTTSSPVLLAIKDNLPHQYTSLLPLTSSTPTESLTSWLLANRIPTTLELTQDTFQDVMKAPHRPLVAIVVVPTEGKAIMGERVKQLGLEWRQRMRQLRNNDDERRDVVFTWMDAEKWASWLKSMYGIQSDDLPAVVIADHQNLLYYDTDSKDGRITTDNLLPVIEGIFAGKVSYKYSENIMERMARHLNNGIMRLDRFVRGHPYQTAFFFIGTFGAFVLIVRKCISDDIASFSDSPKPKLRSD